MSGDFVLDWATMAVSLFNTITTIWLGLTVLLNAERRTLGIWLAGGGLLMGGAFFLSHTAILGFAPTPFAHSLDFWWRFGWVPVVIAPVAWYVVMLWYAGFWEDRRARIYRRHRLWFWLFALAGVTMVVMLLLADSLPSFVQVIQLDLSATPSVMGAPALLLFYPFYILACIGLSMDALLRPGATMRMMGHLARRRALPWLFAASLALLLVGLLVGAVVFWLVAAAREPLSASRYPLDPSLGYIVAWLDLVISALIGAAILLTGQAIVSYEVFTGRSLPRRGLMRYWYRALILAAGYSIAIGLSVTLGLPSIYSLLLSTCLLVAFYALLGWRSYAERENFIARLRPFVASQQLYEQMLAPEDGSEIPDLGHTFCALCEEILGARLAHLLPLGPMAPLFGAPLSYPHGAQAPVASLPEISSRLDSPDTLCLPLEAEAHGGVYWAVSLWNESGLGGVLLLGEKRDGGLYTQEEIEIARAAGERLMDIQASAQMARRLMALQRQRLTQSQLGDHRARRILHDDVLPRLHAAILDLSSQRTDEDGESSSALDLLGEVHYQIADLLREMPVATAPEVARLGLIGALRQVLENELDQAFDRVEWQVDPQAERNARRIPPLTAEVLYYAARETLRNAAWHARDPQSADQLHLRVEVNWENGLEITIEDNGVGIDDAMGAQRGSGQGLALHSTMLAVVGGSLSVESPPDASTRVRLSLPVSGLDDPERSTGAPNRHPAP